MPGPSFITHKGVRILYEDFSYLKPGEALDIIEQTHAVIKMEPPGSVLALVNVKGSTFNTAVISAMKEFTKANAPYIKCAAVYGVEGLKEIMFRGIQAFAGRKNVFLFKSLEEAKDFLVSQK